MLMEAESTFVHETIGWGARSGFIEPVWFVSLEYGRILVLRVPFGLDIEVCVVDKVSWLVDGIHHG